MIFYFREKCDDFDPFETVVKQFDHHNNQKRIDYSYFLSNALVAILTGC
jgi:hypothetical protein